MRVRGFTRGTTALLFALLATSPSVVRAQTASTEALESARQAFKAGVQLEKDEQYEEALAKFEETAAVKTTPQVRFHIGLCNEKLGRFGAAIEAYEAAAKQAATDGNAPEVAKAAPELAQKLRENRPRVTVSFGNAAFPDSLKIDGKEVSASEAKEYPLDPGPHVIIAASGDRTAREEIKVSAGEKATVRMELKSEAKNAALFTDPAETSADTPAPRPPVNEAPKTSATRKVGWVVGGLGLASLGVAGAFFVLRNNAVHELEDACAPNRTCPTSSQATYDRAKTYNIVSIAALGAGAAALVVGTTLIISGKPSEPTPPPVARVVPWAPGAMVGFGLEGAF